MKSSKGCNGKCGTTSTTVVSKEILAEIRPEKSTGRKWHHKSCWVIWGLLCSHTMTHIFFESQRSSLCAMLLCYAKRSPSDHDTKHSQIWSMISITNHGNLRLPPQMQHMPGNKAWLSRALLRDHGIMVVNNPLIRPLFLGEIWGLALGGWAPRIPMNQYWFWRGVALEVLGHHCFIGWFWSFTIVL